MFARLLAATLLFGLLPAKAQVDSKEQIKIIRGLAKQGSDAIPQLDPYLKSSDSQIRREAVDALVAIGTQHSLDPLTRSTRDNDPDVQVRATDGLVNFYLPGYVKTGMTAGFRRAGTSIKSRFTDTNDQVIDAYVPVRPEVVQGIGGILRGGSSMDARANAARALGILRARAALPDLEAGLHVKDDQVIYESLVAIQKIRDPAAASEIAFLLRDLNEKIQIKTLETTGVLQNRAALPEVRSALEHASNDRVRRAALTSLALLPDPASRNLLVNYLNNGDDGMRQAAAEGLGRLHNASDRPMLEKVIATEKKTPAKLGMAFALVALGREETTENSPLQYLIGQLDSRFYKDVAEAYLMELARDPNIRQAMYPQLANLTKGEKIGMADVLGASGDSATLPYLETLGRDSNAEVAQQGLRAVRTLRTRIQP